jgi:competence protein ComEC
MTRALGGGWLPPISLVLGSLGALLFTGLPSTRLLWLLTGCGVAALLVPSTRWLAAILLACCWSLWNFQWRLDDRLEPSLSGQLRTVTGVIASIPQSFDDYVSFRFQTSDSATDALTGLRLPRTLLLRWYQEWPALSAGERWRFELLLKPPWGPVNFQGPDREQWLFASGIGGVATIRSGWLEAPSDPYTARLAVLRESIFIRIGQQLDNRRTAAIVQALAVADRSGLAAEDRELLALTGTSHLLAVSGLHIGLAAAGGILLTRVLGWLLPMPFLVHGFHWLVLGGGALVATAYAALAGFGVPTVRSLTMLLVALAAISAKRAIHPVRGWLLALAAVLLIDPFAPLAAGFWFSFTAVAALLWLFMPRRGHRGGWRTPVLAQSAVILALLPVSAAWFGGFSWIALAANLVAIPVVSFGVVPLVLGGVASLALSGQVAGFLWFIAAGVSNLLLSFLEQMAAVQGQLTPLAAPNLIGSLVALLGAALLLLPRGIMARWLGLFLLAPLFLPPAQKADDGGMELEVLDAGQGTAAVLRSAGRVLLYDSGPGDGTGRDMVQSVIAPALARAGRHAPDHVIISHGDLDHAGGLGSLRARYPLATYRGNLPHPLADMQDCRTPLAWAWRDTVLRVLHPSPGLPYRGNDSSCVLDIARGGRRILLSGDISAAVEARLLRNNLLLPSEILLVPHHGSLTSSSAALIDAVQPKLAVVTASLGNRFGFPRPEIRERYEKAGVPFWSTGECGALRIVLNSDGSLRATSARLQRPAVWRWPAAAHCPGDWRLP